MSLFCGSVGEIARILLNAIYLYGKVLPDWEKLIDLVCWGNGRFSYSEWCSVVSKSKYGGYRMR
jgi:hypothetical protein